MTYILDTNIFNRLVDGKFLIDQLPANGPFVATHIQIDEINKTKDSERRAQLFIKFAEIGPKVVPTESAVWDVSRWGQAKWGGNHHEQLKRDLDALNKAKANNAQDALIAEVALVNGYTLVTADQDLSEVAQKHGAKVFSLAT